MNVERILNNKGHDVYTVAPGATVAEAVALLRARRVGALVVSGDGRTVGGIVSERDIVAGLADRGAALLAARVDEIMTRDVRTCAPGDTSREVLALMTELRFRHLPVLRDGRLDGIVSIGDVVKSRLDEIQNESEALRNYVMGVQQG